MINDTHYVLDLETMGKGQRAAIHYHGRLLELLATTHRRRSA